MGKKRPFSCTAVLFINRTTNFFTRLISTPKFDNRHFANTPVSEVKKRQNYSSRVVKTEGRVVKNP